MAVTIDEVASVLEQAEHVHGVVSEPRGGADPEWPLFYAWWLVTWSSLPERLGAVPTISELASELIAADRDFRAEERSEPWAAFYARRLTARSWSDARE